MGRTKYVVIGGFLGAGKTTAIIAMANHIRQRGDTVALIANDQSEGLVDTARMRAAGYRVEEITGGCFCCRFDDLVASSSKLRADGVPQVLIAEAVGSCTDLQATVTYPLREYFGDSYSIAPLSVLVDPNRCASILGLWGRDTFSEKVEYVYRKQLEEAEILVIHKSDVLSSGRRDALAAELTSQFPNAAVLAASSVSGEGLDAWYERLFRDDLGDRPTMEIDYDLYAEGEALLGWVNVQGTINAPEPLDGNVLLVDVGTALTNRLIELGIEIAHFKATIAPPTGDELGAVSVTTNSTGLVVTKVLTEHCAHGDLILNLRAEADPEILRHEMLDVLQRLAVPVQLDREAAFRPGRPVPTHRFVTA